MSAAGWTPGPWTVEHHRGAYIVRYGEEGNNAVACSFNYAKGIFAQTEQMKADATLCAAAPDLAEALQAIVAAPHGIAIGDFERAQAALKKAGAPNA